MSDSDTPHHKIVGIETIVAEAEFGLTESGEPENTELQMIDVLDPDDNIYECTCGIEFGYDWDGAIQHLRRMRRADDSEGTVEVVEE